MTTPAAPTAEFVPRLPRGYEMSVSWWRRHLGFTSCTVVGAPSTTRQTEILNPGVLAAPLDVEGILVGEDTLTSTMVLHDPLTAYELGLLDSPNVAVIGDVGSAKSSLLKTLYVLRALLLKDRRVVVVDKKLSDDRDHSGEQVGEYARTAEVAGVAPIRFRIGGGGSCINICDPALTGRGKGGTLGILQAACELLSGERLDRWEKKALRVALHTAIATAASQGRVATIHDVIGQLMRPARLEIPTHVMDQVELASIGVAFLLEELVEEMPGLFDGPTSADVQLGAKLTVFDISALPEQGASINIVMMLVNVWVLGNLRDLKRAGHRDSVYFVTDEGWYLVGGPMGKVIQSNAKLSRGLGLVNVVGIHHIGDIPQDDPAIAFIKDAGTLHLYRQAKTDEADTVARIVGLRPGSAETLGQLPKGHHLLKVGTRAEVYVKHLRSDIEIRITDTDSALTAGRGRRTPELVNA